MDARSRALGGEPSWIRSNIEIHSHSSAMTSHDWMNVIQSAGDYTLAGLFPQHPRRMEALFKLLDACNGCLRMESPRDDDNRDQVDRLKLQMVEALVLCESVLPVVSLAPMLHVLLHVPDTIYRWNSVRNFWCFFGERYLHDYISILRTTIYHACTLGVWVTSSASSTTGILRLRTS